MTLIFGESFFFLHTKSVVAHEKNVRASSPRARPLDINLFSQYLFIIQYFFLYLVRTLESQFGSLSLTSEKYGIDDNNIWRTDKKNLLDGIFPSKYLLLSIRRNDIDKLLELLSTIFFLDCNILNQHYCSYME
jgi:hypothetical protein